MKKLVLIGVVFCLVFSCNQEPVETNTQLNVDYNAFANELKHNLDLLATDLRESNRSFLDVGSVELSAKEVFQTEVYESFSQGFDQSIEMTSNATRSRTEEEVIYLSKFQFDVLQEVDKLWEHSNSTAEYKEKLRLLFDKTVEKESTNNSDKESALLYIISQIVALEFVEKNTDLVTFSNPNGRSISARCVSNREDNSNWWDDWGKCAAGIVGGAGVAALGGCAVGAQVGLGIASIPGCGVRGIIRGIFLVV